MNYYVVGVNGSGKTSLLKAIHDKTGMRVVHGTTELMEQFGIPGDYDALRIMDQAKVLMKWGETASQIVEKYKDTDFLLDTHILNLTHGNIIRRDGPWIANYDALILIMATPNTLLHRINNDVNKDRAMFTPEMSEEQKLILLATYQKKTQQLFNELSEIYKLPSLIIENDDALDDGVQRFEYFNQTMSQ